MNGRDHVSEADADETHVQSRRLRSERPRGGETMATGACSSAAASDAWKRSTTPMKNERRGFMLAR